MKKPFIILFLFLFLIIPSLVDSQTSTKAHKHFGQFHTDIDTTTPPGDGQTMVWDETSGKWIPGDVGAGTGDVVGPATNTDNKIPQWNGANSKELKDGLALDTDGALTANSDTIVASQKATKTYADTKMPSSYLDTDGTLTANSDAKVASQKAVKTYADTKFAVAASANRGATAPDNPFEGMFWWDTSENPVEVLKRYTVTAGWVSLLSVNITTGATLLQGYDTDLATFSLPANTTISAFMKTVLDDADAGTARGTLGVDAAGTDNNPTGAIIAWPTDTPPAGYLECNGASLDRTTYAALFAVIGTMYGTADGTHFNLPDYRGRFLRSWAHGSVNDPDRDTRTAPGAAGATLTAGDHVGTEQADAFESHNHTESTVGGGEGYTAGPAWSFGPVETDTGDTGGNETRPINVNVMYCIKY